MGLHIYGDTHYRHCGPDEMGGAYPGRCLPCLHPQMADSSDRTHQELLNLTGSACQIHKNNGHQVEVTAQGAEQLTFSMSLILTCTFQGRCLDLRLTNGQTRALWGRRVAKLMSLAYNGSGESPEHWGCRHSFHSCQETWTQVQAPRQYPGKALPARAPPSPGCEPPRRDSLNTASPGCCGADEN